MLSTPLSEYKYQERGVAEHWAHSWSPQVMQVQTGGWLEEQQGYWGALSSGRVATDWSHSPSSSTGGDSSSLRCLFTSGELDAVSDQSRAPFSPNERLGWNKLNSQNLYGYM